MVTVFLRGGLGNQMFQYAAGLAMAERNKTGLMLDSVLLNDRFPRREFTYRNFDLDIFTLEPKLTKLSKISEKTPIPGVWLGLDIAAMTVKNAVGSRKLIKEKGEFIFEPQVLKEKGNLILSGYWQNEKYFTDMADKVRGVFTFRHELTGEAAALERDIRSSHSISLHVRRGDYVEFKSVAKMMGGTDVAYYERAVRYIASKVDAPKFFVFSNDIEWCKKNLPIPFPAVYVSSESAGPKAAFHLELMSLCKHNIIANSTFSWWGAWLNNNPAKIVVGPERWRANGSGDESGIMPERWIKL